MSTTIQTKLLHALYLPIKISNILKLEAQWDDPVSLTFHSDLRKRNTESSIGASHQISVHFGKAVSEKNIFRNRPI